MRFKPLDLDGAWSIELDRHVDERGFFARAFCESEFAAHGLPASFPQCNLSSNRRAATLRGMHASVPEHPEPKLVRCVRGAIHDVIVDLRPDSATFGASASLALSSDNGLAVFVPAGFAHGFLTLVDDTDVYYHMGSSFIPEAARGFRWNDPRFDLNWPRDPACISERDATYTDFDASEFGLIE